MESNNQIESKNDGFARFLILWVGELLSNIGSGLTAFALGIYTFKMTGQATSATLVTLFTFLPAFLLRPVGGVMADRIDRRLLMIFGNLGSALGIGLVFIFMSTRAESLWMIYIGIAISSIFYAFQNPAYKASVSDFLPRDLYTKASGLVQLSGSAQLLLAPLIAGFLMAIMDVKYILIIDILSFVISAVNIIIIRRSMGKIATVTKSEDANLMREIAEGFKAVVTNRGIVILILVISLALFYIGLLQSLFAPMVLSFTDSRTLGTSQSICAVGMLVSSLMIGVFGGKRKHSLTLAISLGFMGVFFALIGIRQSVWAIIIPGFLFFLTIPFVNSSIEVLIRQNISNETQGRVWALISVITNIGSMIAYAIAGFLADKVCNPLFMPDGLLAPSLGRVFGVGPGRGIAFIFFISGIFVVILAAIMFRLKSIQQLECNEDSAIVPAEKLDINEV